MNVVRFLDARLRTTIFSCIYVALSSVAYAEASVVPHLEWALEFRNLLQVDRGDQIVCEALAAEFKATLQNDNHGCHENVVNLAKSVIFRVEPQATVGTYQITLLAKSTELILNNRAWCERHRLDVLFGYDSNMYPRISVLDNEPMVRTTPDLQPEMPLLFEYIPKGMDREISDLQERIRNAVVKSLTNHVIAAREKKIR